MLFETGLKSRYAKSNNHGDHWNHCQENSFGTFRHGIPCTQESTGILNSGHGKMIIKNMDHFVRQNRSLDYLFGELVAANINSDDQKN